VRNGELIDDRASSAFPSLVYLSKIEVLHPLYLDLLISLPAVASFLLPSDSRALGDLVSQTFGIPAMDRPIVVIIHTLLASSLKDVLHLLL